MRQQIKIKVAFKYDDVYTWNKYMDQITVNQNWLEKLILNHSIPKQYRGGK
jgi:hypothetical protein